MNNLPRLNLPHYSFRFKKSSEGKNLIFDEVRKKWLMLTPEEWVRQNIIKFLIKSKNYPESVFKIESGLIINQNKKRADIVVFKNDKPFILIECKAPNIQITDLVFDQAANYNIKLKCPYMILTNGLNHVTVKSAISTPEFQKEFPGYKKNNS